ncbi:MAG: manganese efflux pump [Clostridia bacterium]|nr:manganese efflux pump [Clostridia bacterium]
MNFTDIIMIGIGLSMDAVAVSLTNGMVYRMGKDKKFMMPVFFGIFQGLMPLLGYFTGGIFSKWLVRYSGWIIFFILGFLGAKMVKEGLSHERLEKKEPTVMTYGVLFVQAIATSIDAFAVGIAFCTTCVSIWSSSAIICVTTFICSFIAVLIGKKFGEFLGKKAEVFGGSILILLALKALLF